MSYLKGACGIVISIISVFFWQSLLDEPNPNSPANSLAAQLYQENRREYEKRVAAIVEQSWLNFQVRYSVQSSRCESRVSDNYAADKDSMIYLHTTDNVLYKWKTG